VGPERSSSLFEFDARTLTGWAQYQLSFPGGGAQFEGGFGLDVRDGELYRHVGFLPLGAPQSVLVQKLKAPPP
jgi:hypothetical protein